MRIPPWLRHSVQIARTERMRSKRQLGRSSAMRAVIAIVLVGVTITAGFGAYAVGTAVRHGQVTLPVEPMQAAATVCFLVLLIGFVQRTARVTERLETDLLLTTVSAREVVLGVVLAVSSRTVSRLSLITVGVSVGFAVGARSPANALTIIVALTGFFALTALSGVSVRFAMDLVSTRSPRFRRYRTVFVVAALGLVTTVWMAAIRGWIATERLVGWLSVAPPAWFVDLGLLSVSGIQSGLPRSAGALGLLVGGIPLLTVVTTALATRVWETEPVSAATIHRSRSLVGAGVAEYIFAGHVSRPVLTVARKRWLQERRAPLGLLMSGYLIVPLLGVVLPILAAGEVPGISLVVLAFICASGTGIGFGLSLLSLEYSSLQMTLTTVSGRQFIRGTLLAGVAPGGPVTVLGILVLGIWSPLGILELLVLAVGGVALCVCSVTLAATLSLRLSYYEFRPVPLPFTNASVYGVVGVREFVNLGVVLALVGLICLPAFVVYGAVFFDGPVATAPGASTAVARIGSLVLLLLLAVGVSMVAYRRAVRSYDQYSIP